MFRSKKALAFIVISAMVLCGGAGVGLFTDTAYANGLSGVGSHGSGILSTLFGKTPLQTSLFGTDKAFAETDSDTEEETEAPTEAPEPTEAPTKPEPQEPTQAEPADEPGSEVTETEPQQEETAPTEEEEVLKERNIKANLIIDPLYKDAKRKHKTEAFQSISSFWKNLMQRKTPAAEEGPNLKVTISGMLPKDATADCIYIPMADSDIFTEQGLYALEVVILDKDGAVYIPADPVTITVKDKDFLQAQVKDGNAPILYSYMENPKRAKKYTKKYKKNIYAADVTVYKSDNANKKLLNYEVYDKDKKYKGGEDAVRYHNAKDGLIYDKDEVVLEYDYADAAKKKGFTGGPQLLLTSQMTKRTLEATSGDAVVTVTGALAKDVALEVTEITPKDKDYKDYVDKTAETLDKDASDLAFARAFDVKLIDPETGEEFQPDDKVKVSVQLKDEEINDNDLEVVYLKDSKDKDPQLAKAKTSGDTVNFNANELPVVVVAQVLKEEILTASDGKQYKITVTYNANAGIPEDAELAVRELTKKDDGYKDYVEKTAKKLGKDVKDLGFTYLFDIKLLNKETGEQYQPKEDVKVSIELLEEDMSKVSDVNVLHFKEGFFAKLSGPEVMESSVKGDAVEFRTDGFSVYALTGEDAKPQCTYTFYVPDPDMGYREYAFTDAQGKTIYSQTITSGEELVVPQLTSTETEVFAGWYKGDRTGGTLTIEEEPYDFENITISENSAIDLYAVFKDYATVVFHDQYDSGSGEFPISYTRRAELVTSGEGDSATTSATVKISDISSTYTSNGGANMAFSGWSRTPITTPGAAKDDAGNDVKAVSADKNGCITVTGETHLYPIYIETYLLSFYAAATGSGAAYNGPRYLNKGESIEELPTTSVDGYTFTGWYTGNKKEGVSDPKPGEDVIYGTRISDADGSLSTGADDAGVYVSDGKLYMRADTTLYARWEANTSAEYKILYWQQNGNQNTYSYKESVTRTGTVGETVSVADADKANDRYDDFHLKEEPASAKVKADGSTVLHVYYDHNEGYTPTEGTSTLTFADSVTEEGKASPRLPQTKSVVNGTSLAEQAIENPTSGRKGYKFSNWYLDPSCTKEVDWKAITMPDHDLTVYAGWELEWYVVSIDPNYGELRPLNDQGVPTGTGSTWFWQTIEREPIAEYTYVERNYVESSSGTYYYVYHPGDGAGNTVWPDRYTYYTKDISKATEDTTFEYSPGTYTYAGWYEQHEDGSETPYVFGERTDHNTSLKLHWKKKGVYYLRYNAVVGDITGTMDDADKSESLFEEGKYADYAEITLTHAAIAPSGYTFVGWQVHGSDSNVIYTPGQIFTLNAEYAKRVSGKDVVDLDAVYAKVETASIIYNANGGTIAQNGVDFGKVPGSAVNEWNNASGTVDTDAGIATVSGLPNNSKFKLSGGTGFTAPADSGASFLGWSDKAVCDDSATFYDKDSNVIYGVSESTTLYAVWGTKVTYHLSPDEGDDEWGDDWDSEVYTKDDVHNVYYQTAKIGSAVAEPENVPNYIGDNDLIFRYWATRTGSGTDEDPYKYTEYDFSQPVTGALDLYAYWGTANIVPVHAVDASEEGLVDKTGVDGWVVKNVTVDTDEVELTGTSFVTTPDPDNYEFAFAAVADADANDLDAVSESNAVTAIKYENNKFKVKYKGESSFRALGAGKGLYFVYYLKKTRKIGYKSMDASGVLVDVTPEGGAPQTTALLGECDMSSEISAPLSYVSSFTNYAFAIGGVDPENNTEMNASNLSLITDVAGKTDTVPTLRIRNTWRGFQYTTEAGNDAEWTSCGYDPQLYVIYYTQAPTVVMFHEKTVGTSSMMDTEFTFNLQVTQATTTTTSVQTQIKNQDDEWENSGEPRVTETTGDPETVFDTKAAGNQPYILKNGESNSAILFYSSSTQTGEPVEGENEYTRTITTTTTTTAQTALITQEKKNDFTTIVKADGDDEAETLSFTCSTDGKGGTKNVTFTNVYKSLLPRIKYVKEGSDGKLTDITGCIENTTTGDIEACDFVTYGHETIKMNGRTVAQDQYLEVPQSGQTISQKGNNFRMPPVLDDGLYERYLSYKKIGAAGIREATSSNTLDISTGLNMQLKIEDDTLKYSFDGETWTAFTSETPTIYAIYSERGYDLQISKTIDTSQSGENALFSGASFTVTISSTGITKNSYEAEGADSSTVDAVQADGTKPGTITMTVTDGTRIRIKGLGKGDYTITEGGNENYTLTARTGSIVGGSTSPMTVTDNTSVSFTLDSEKKVDLTNSPKAICRIEDNYFYTLRSMVDYVDENIATKTATAEMLTDYLLPAADTVEIPSDLNLTLTTADSVGRVAVITRTADLAAVPLFTNNGALTLTNLTLEGSSIEATAPMIRSAGDLTVGSGASIQNVVGGGAINATAGNITVSGTIQNCSAAEGGAIYHSGNSTITLNGTGTIQNNTATSGSGGAIWLSGGTVEVSVKSKITGNKAESGNGGAVYADGIVEIEIDQGGAITGNTAKEGGAIYAKASAAISISETENLTVKPAVTGNTATTGNGGAIYVYGGSVSVSGGSVSNNKAENGQGGAVYANTASVAVSGTAEVKSNTAKEGGAVYADSGAVTVSGGSLDSNTASNGSGGGIYADSGKVTVSGGSVSQNTATNGSGGGIYADSGNVIVSGAVSITGTTLAKNTADSDGGAVFAGSGSITVSVPDSGTAATIQSNTATEGKGGAFYANTGAVSITGTTLAKNTAGSDGGAVYADSGTVTLTNSVFGRDTDTDGNTAGGSGGAIYVGSGNLTVSGGSMQNNKSNTGNGGAVYAGSGAVTVSTVSLSANCTTATAGKGGAIYLDSGSLTLTTITATGNSAINGAAIFTNTGRATFNAGSYTGNTAFTGGAVGVGSSDARLYFNGNVQVKDNKLGTDILAPKSNVYLDQDDDAVINIDTLGSSASIGIYVADSVENTRGVPGARFAVYTNNSNASNITNDRYSSLTIQSDTAAKKFYWGNGIRIEVMYRASYANGLPNGTSSGRGTTVKDIGTYYPTINSEGELALSELAADVYTRYPDVSNGLKSHPNAIYGAAFYDNASDYSYDISTLAWNKTDEKWQVKMRNGQTVDLPGRIYVIYSEPAYISIENNTEEKLTASDLKMTVNGSDISVINSSESMGYGMVFAKNGAIRTALLPITEDDLTLEPGQSVSLLIPGGQYMAYKLDGKFETEAGASVRLRRGEESSLSEETTESVGDGIFKQLTGYTLNTAGTYYIIFGSNKIICKVVDASGHEHPYNKISDAIADIVATTGATPPYTLTTAKTATIEMVTDYLLTASDDVNIPKGYDITLTTAAKEGATYCYNGKGTRATISRDTLNTDSMIKAWNALENNKVTTTLRLNNLIIDGKSVRGSSDGGAVATQYTNVYIDTVDFKNVYASNGGALLVMFNFDRPKEQTKNKKHTVSGTFLNVKDSDFIGCTSTTDQKSNRLGGGAIVTNAETMTLENCDFSNCTSVDQAGAVFHRIDYNDNSYTNITGCTFTNCSADAAGGLELDSKTINVTDCTFEHCVAKARNGGGFNVYALNDGAPTADCWVTVSGCTFNDCQLTTTNTSNGNGGGFRCNAVYTKVVNSTFTNNLALFGGGFCISNGNAKKAEVYGCSFERNTANNGGGVYGKPANFVFGDCRYITTATEIDNLSENDAKSFSSSKTVNGTTYYTYAFVTDTDSTAVDKANAFKSTYNLSDDIETRETEIKNCTSKNEGGGIYHDKNADNTSLTITNATISGNRTTNSGKNGGGVFTNCREVEINGAAITDNTCTSQGGGVYAYSYTSLSIADSDISRNIASSNGGGVWFDADNDNNRAKQTLTIKGSSIDGNTSNNGIGGGVYTLAKTVTIDASETKTDTDGNAIRSSISNNTAKTNGGGIYQSRNVEGSKLEISNADVCGNTANNTSTNTDQGGGGIFAGVRTLNITKSTVSNNTAKSNGGGILFEINSNDARNDMSLTIEGCTLSGNTSNANGGGIYTKAKTVAIGAHTERTGDSAVVTKSEISNCTTTWSGGGIYQSRDVTGSTLEISYTTISGCVSNDTNTDENTNPRGGGGIYAYIETVTVTDSTISNNTAIRQGGGIDIPWNNGSSNKLVIDSSVISGNSAGYRGGGVFSRADLTLRNNTEITGNRLTTNTAANCAGVYLINNRTLYVGPENATEGKSDTIIVRNNTTANNTLSDLRLWDNGSENNAASVYVYCNLSNDSEIRVVNAAKAGTQFGSSALALTNGFSDGNAVFKADSSTLYGITARTDPTYRTIIWAGPPIAKLTDGNGRLLYIKYYEGTATYPAIFDRLDTGNNSEGSIASPFSILRMDELKLYYNDGTEYTGEEDPDKVDYCIKMLVERYETSSDMTLPSVDGRTVTFTTAEKSFPTDWPYEDNDTYHFEGKSGGRATVIRGSTVSNNRSLMNVRGNLNLQNIVIDGGTENGVSLSGSTRCMYIDYAFCAVTLGENAVLQNGKINSGDGGGVYINSGTLTISGGIIRNCEAKNDGGGVFSKGDNVILEAGSIYQCAASGSGGGVRVKQGSFTMSGGQIRDCSANNGGGVYLGGNRSLNMSGGAIINNSAIKTGGGVAIWDDTSRIYLSGKVNISGNTCDASVARNNACNIELDRDSYKVINTNNGGLYPGAYIGVYVPGTESTNSNYDKHGVERKPFGTFTVGDNTTNFYSFVNDRNGLKGGIIETTDPNYVQNWNCIYWIQIFSLEVTKEVVSGDSTTVDPDEVFLFKVNVRGNATVTGQPNAAQIDSSTGDYGEMQFTSNGTETTTAVFGLIDGQTISGVNLSEGLIYEVTEYLTEDQYKRYAAMPMNGAGSTTESLTYNGETYQVIRVNTYASRIGENKTRTDVDPYTSALTFSNVMPVCKITDMDGNILYQRYDWKKVTNKTGEGEDGGNSTNQPYYYAPAVFTELTGDDGAFKALEGTLYRSNGSNPTSYSVSNGVKIQMLIGDYKLNETIGANTSKVTLTTASSEDALFPKQDAGTTSTIRRNNFSDDSMFDVSGDLTFATVILDGVKSLFTVAANGGIANVENGGELTVQSGATLQNSRTDEDYNGGAVFVANGGIVHMTGGTINRNESDGDGAGIYLTQGGKLYLSGKPGFGGPGTNVSGNITTTNGNFKNEDLKAKLNGGKEYKKPRQDIYIAGYSGSDGDKNAASLVVGGDITSPEGSIWVWAEKSPHYKTLEQFAQIELLGAVSDTESSLKAFRNARDDDTTGNNTDTYLYGTNEEDSETPLLVYWSGIKGSREVILRKVTESGSGNDKQYQSLKNATFTVYRGSKKVLENAVADESGVFWAGELPYGDYLIEETSPSTSKWFYLIVDDNTLSEIAGDGGESVRGYSSETAAKAAMQDEKASRKANPLLNLFRRH